jgi:hypothetical protein
MKYYKVMAMKINTKFADLTIVASMLLIAALFAATTTRQESEAASGFIIGDGKGTLGCPEDTNQPASIRFSATNNGNSVSGTVSIALMDGTATGAGEITKGQVAKNHYFLEGNWNRGDLCGLTDSHSFSVSGIPGHIVLIQFFDVCSNCKHNFSGTVIIAPTK